MKRILSLTLAILMLVAALSGCNGDNTPAKQLTAEERTQLYKTAIEGARDAEANEYQPVVSEANEETEFLMEVLGLSASDMDVFGLSVSMMNVKAYGIAAVYPAEGKADTVKEGLQGFIDRQKQNFEQYLADQYEVASNAKLETLSDGTILMVMCEGQDEVFASIKSAILDAQ